MLPTRDPVQIERHTQTESKGVERRYFMQIFTKAGISIHIWDRLQNKGYVASDKEYHIKMLKGRIQLL